MRLAERDDYTFRQYQTDAAALIARVTNARAHSLLPRWAQSAPPAEALSVSSIREDRSRSRYEEVNVQDFMLEQEAKSTDRKDPDSFAI